MPNRRFDWHEHIKDVEGEFNAARVALDRFADEVLAKPDIVVDRDIRGYVRSAREHLEGTYLVRLFAAFEAALRSYDRANRSAPTSRVDAAILIDNIGGRRGRDVLPSIRQGAQEVRRVRNYWAHEDDSIVERMTVSEARARLQKYLAELPDEWG